MHCCRNFCMRPYFARVISASLSPNAESDDVALAVSQLFSPRRWKDGPAIGEVETWFRAYSDASVAVSFDSGRSALFALLESFGITAGDEVIVQAFTCVAVPNAVIGVGATPIFVDIDDTLNIDPQKLAASVNSRTKAIIVQHTFGIPAVMEKILAVARKHKLLVIEDCAHSLGVMYNGKKIGTFGDAAFYSFGRDKVLSSVWGGVATLSHTSGAKAAMKNLVAYQKQCAMPSNPWIVQQLLHPILFSVIIPFYNSGIGKLLLVLAQRLGVLSLPVKQAELKGLQLESPKRYPNALANLLKRQLGKRTKFEKNREDIVSLYIASLKNKGFMLVNVQNTMNLLRFPLLTDSPATHIARAKSRGILLGNWYSHVIDPANCDLNRIGYMQGSCPNAERIAKRIINLPTRIARTDARRILDLLCL